MATSYTDQLEEWVKQKKGSARDKHLVTFLAIKEDVRLAMNAGYSAKTIWQNMRELGRVSFTYALFLKYVSLHIKDNSKASAINAETDAKPTPKTATDKNSSKIQSQPKKVGMPTFKFNPIVKHEDN